MSKLQHAQNEILRIYLISAMESSIHCINVRAKLLTTFVFLIIMLSVSTNNLSNLIPYSIFPILIFNRSGISFTYLLKRSSMVLPFIILIALFNPILDKQVAFYIGSIAVTKGWISFFSILLRGFLSTQAAYLLILTSGFYNVCRGMQKMGMSILLSTQMMFVYRYLFVLINESITMCRGRDSRSYGRNCYCMKIWRMIIGQLFIRSFDRAERINNAMLSRGFKGEIPSARIYKWQLSEMIFVLSWSAFFLFLRLAQPMELLVKLI